MIIGFVASFLTYLFINNHLIQSLLFISNYLSYIFIGKLFHNPTDIGTVLLGISVFFLVNIIQYTLIGYLIDLNLAKKKKNK